MGAWLRDNFDKLLLAALFMGLVSMVLHLAHANLDVDATSWAREQAATVLGGLLMLITGRALRGHQDATSIPPQVPLSAPTVPPEPPHENG